MTLEQVQNGIHAAWTHLDTLAKAKDYDGFAAAMTDSLQTNDTRETLPSTLSTLISVLEHDGWTVVVDPHHPDWEDAAQSNGHTVDQIYGLTNHCQKRVLLKVNIPVQRVIRTAAHEIGHAYGVLTLQHQLCEHNPNATDEDRKRRFIDSVRASILGGYPNFLVEMETEAELTALFVLESLGFDLAPSFYYLAQYRQRGYRGAEHFDTNVLPKAWVSAQKVAARVFAALHEEREAA